MGLFSVQSLQEVADALLQSNPQRMLEIVQELERNGRSLQHFCRELSRYFRNLLVSRISGAETKLIAASAAEQARMRETAGRFSEEDLTRYLQLSLELFKDMQASLQPRLHLEMGLIRLVQAGRLLPIEQALSIMSGRACEIASSGAVLHSSRTGPSPFAMDSSRRWLLLLRPRRPRSRCAGRGNGSCGLLPSPGRSEVSLYTALTELGCNFTADAVEASEVSDVNGELCFVTPSSSSWPCPIRICGRPRLQALGKPYRIKVTVGTPVNAQQPVAKPKPVEDEVDAAGDGRSRCSKFPRGIS